MTSEETQKEIIKLASTIFDENLSLRNIHMGTVDVKNTIMYESKVFSNSMKELVCGGLSPKRNEALGLLLKTVNRIYNKTK